MKKKETKVKVSKYTVKSDGWLWEVVIHDSGLTDYDDRTTIKGDENKIWAYSFWRGTTEVFDGSMVGQYDEEPELNEILIELSGHLHKVMIEFAKHGEKQ